MIKKMSYMDYKTKIFNEAFKEACSLPYCGALNGCGSGGSRSDEIFGGDPNITKRGSAMFKKFFADECGLAENTIGQTKKLVEDAVEYVKQAADLAEDIAEEKTDNARKEGIEFEADQEPELSQEDKAVIQQLFDVKAPTPQIDKIRDATVQALIKEDEKSKEIKDALDIAKSKVNISSKDKDKDEAKKAQNETMNRINNLGPHSLMGSIINSVSASVINSMNEAGTLTNIGKALRENSDNIRDRSMAIYAIFETMNQLGTKNYTPHEVEELSESFYYST